MKIGILTQHFYRNYGGIVQNYALQQMLIKLGHVPITFEHDTCYSRTRWVMRVIKQIIRRRNFKSLSEYPYKCRIGHRPFIDFVVDNISSVMVRNFTGEIESVYGCEAFIVGSDQVWRPAFNVGRLYNMYLDFASNDVKKIAYAASFGVSDWEYTEKETQKCKSLVSQFDAVSVRENSGIELCQTHLGVDAKWVLDPTLLLDSNDYEAVCQNVSVDDKFVFVYALHLNNEMQDYAQQIANQLDLNVKILQAGNRLKSEDTIEKWLASFRDAEVVVTDSFHGMAFSVIFNKPFHIFKNESGGVARYESLLIQLGIENRIVMNKKYVNTQPINWDVVNRKRQELKQDSIEFLNKELACKQKSQ